MRRKQSKNYIFDYYQHIKDGRIVVSKWIELIYEYIVHGIEDKTFEFDARKAASAIDWIEVHCFHTEGPLAPNPIKLELWQKSLLSCLFGVLNPKTHTRQFRECVLIVARKNGKSLLASAIAKYIFYVDGGYGTRIYCLAPKLEQADIIYGNVWQMIQLDPEWQALRDEIKASKDAHNTKTMDDSTLARHRQTDLCIPGTNSTVKKIAFSAKKSDGFNPSLTICDEIASWEGDRGLKQYEVMKSAMGARDMGGSPSILLSCSTAGYINDSIYDELFKRATRFLMGDSKEKRLLPFLYTIDDIQKWNDINELRKSNPNLGVSISVDYLLDEIAVAEGSLSKKAEFITKYCNLKQNSSQAWLATETVDKCCGAPLSIEDFRGCYCVGGIDLSQTTDLTSCCALIEKGGELYVFSQFFLPAEKIQEATERDGIPYQAYVQRGILKLSGENFVDYDDCFQWFKALIEKHEVYPLQVGYDKWMAQNLVKDMEQYGFHMDDVYQGFNLTPVLREMEGLMKDGKVHIGDNDLLKIHLLDAALKMDTETSKVKLIKMSPTAHIDGTAALSDAFCVRQKWYDQIGGQLRND